MNYELIDAARLFINKLRNASEKDLDEAFQRIAHDANDSIYAQTHEPLQGLCAAFMQEQKRRLLHNKDCEHGNVEEYCEVCHPELESDEDYEKRTTPVDTVA